MTGRRTKTAARIVGISLVRNEDLFLETVIRNVLEFCDRLIIADHGSRDRTPEIAAGAARRHGHVEYHPIARAPESHELVRPYAGTRTWVFAVDGDEIYDPRGLALLRGEILEGRHDGYRQIYGHAFHCESLDMVERKACGYLSPPCRTVTKLYNFGALRDWEGPCPERLHGGRIVFAEGYDASMNLDLKATLRWDESHFRCLHTVFLRRSSLDRPGEGPRRNISEKNEGGVVGRLSDTLRGALGRRPRSSYKEAKYRRGKRLFVDASPFLGVPGEAR